MITLNSPGQAISGRTNNLSRGGLCATLSAPIAVGITVDVDIQLVFADDLQSEALRIPARVVWCTSLDEGHQVGVSFLPIDGGKADDLTMFLRYLDDSTPRAKPTPTSVDDRFD
jgi:PilZ domain-containing protein